MAQAIAAGIFWFAGGVLAGVYFALWYIKSDRDRDE